MQGCPGVNLTTCTVEGFLLKGRQGAQFQCQRTRGSPAALEALSWQGATVGGGMAADAPCRSACICCNCCCISAASAG